MIVWARGAQAQTLADLLPEVVQSDERVLAPAADLTAAHNNSRVAWGDYYPQATVTGWAGNDQQLRPYDSAKHSDWAAKEGSVSISQLVYDFGKTGAKIGVAELQETQAKVAVDAARQGVVLDAATAYINLMKATETLRYSRISESNILKQSGLEEARVQKGGGYTTDVLQAKSQLAGAQARRVRAEGALVTARNHFTFVFGERDLKIEDMRWPGLPASVVPTSLADAMGIAEDKSSILKNELLKEDVARGNLGVARSASFFPRIEIVASHDSKKNVSQIHGVENDSTIKLQASMPFNLGGTAVNTLRSADSGVEAATYRSKTTHNQVVEAVRNAWQELSTAKENAAYLRNQANIAGEFLELARKEREHGTRSLLDVLNGETVYINAQSDAIGAEGDVLLAVFKLLYTMGILEPDLVLQAADTSSAGSVVR